MWYFRDLNDGTELIFSEEEKVKEFMKKYGTKMFEINFEFPRENEDYLLRTVIVDRDPAEVIEEMFG